MFDYKFIIMIIGFFLILIVGFFLYKELIFVKNTIGEVKQHNENVVSNLSKNTNQCVDRLEKISKMHINELQNIAKINSQQINCIDAIPTDSDSKSDGLSRQYISPMNNQIDNDPPHEKSDELYESGSESNKIPVYVPKNDAEQNEQEYNDEEESDGLDNDVVLKSGEEAKKTPSDNLFESFLKSMHFMENVAGAQPQLVQINLENLDHPPKQKTPPIIEEIIENSPETPEVKSNVSKKSNKSEKSEKSKHSQIIEDLKNIDEYNLQELKQLAKEYDIMTNIKVDGKVKHYKKSELYDLISQKIKK